MLKLNIKLCVFCMFCVYVTNSISLQGIVKRVSQNQYNIAKYERLQTRAVSNDRPSLAQNWNSGFRTKSPNDKLQDMMKSKIFKPKPNMRRLVNALVRLRTF